MRRATPAESEAWMVLAREHGCFDASGMMQFGRILAQTIDGRPWARLITPLLASPFTEDLRERVPPIRFDRTLDGELRLPGRWWASRFETISEHALSFPIGVRALAARLAHEAHFPATLLPAATDTILIEAAGPQGRRTEYEALSPGTMLPIPVTFVDPKDAPAAN